MTIDPFLFDDDHTIARESDPLFGSLVKNAIDFLRKSVDELEKDPKYSVIHFFAAIELFLKARLLAKNWTLILADMSKVKNEEKAILEKFKEGNVSTVGLEDAIKRLKRECELEISPSAKKYFRTIKKHRNKLVHFFHPEYHKDPPYGTYHEIVPEQLSAWYHLNTLLMDEWEELFEEYADEIHELDSMIMANKKYLSAKYDELKPDIEKEKNGALNIRNVRGAGLNQHGMKTCTTFYILATAVCVFIRTIHFTSNVPIVRMKF